MSNNPHVLGLDFGTDSVRAVLVDSTDGTTLASQVSWYRRWKEGKYCDPSKNQFRQHISDHIEGMEAAINGVVKTSGIDPKLIRGICVDTTGSSPIPVDQEGTALCLTPGFKENPNGMMVLWKDHTAIKEAEEINRLARSWGGEDYTKFEGGIYSTEWFWAKILHVARADNSIKKAAYSWMEHCDLMTYILVGSPDLKNFRRSRCAAGHKAMWHESWGGLPADEFLSKLDPYLVEVKQNLYFNTYTSNLPAGKLSPEWADRLGLNEDVVVAVGTFDAHAGAVGAEVEENTLVRVMGTSTCDIIVSSVDVVGDRTVKGICGQVDGSVLPGMIGLEAGQSAFGDVLAWFKNLISWPLDNYLKDTMSVDELEKIREDMIAALSQQAEKTPINEGSPIALDWINGRRTPDANQQLKAAIVNLSLGTDAPQLFRALVEAICFGSKKIVDRFVEEGVEIKTVVGIGGVAKKSSFIMQTLADVLNMPIKVAVSEQAPALGAAMY
ncbi:MAG: ribulokinase, partial [Cyclobacteriaceae bacterium]